MTRRVPRLRLLPLRFSLCVVLAAWLDRFRPVPGRSWAANSRPQVVAPERRLPLPLVAARATAAVTPDAPAETAKLGRAGGGGDDGPTPPEQLQVTVYRFMLIIAAIGWWAAYSLDFFMTSGINIIDGSIQASALSLADVCAGVAALAAPTGSAVLAGVLLKLMGSVAVGAAALGAAGPGTWGSLAGPACIVVICAREVFWFGLGYKFDAAAAVVIFIAVTLLRCSAVLEPGGSSAVSQVPLQPPGAEEAPVDIGYVQREVLPVGPPVPLSFVASVSLTVVAFSKVFEPIGEDLDEEGEQWAKRSSRSLYDYDGEDVDNP